MAEPEETTTGESFALKSLDIEVIRHNKFEQRSGGAWGKFSVLRRETEPRQ